MIDETYRARWAWRIGFFSCVGAIALACSHDVSDDGDGDGGSGQGGSSGAGPTGGVAPTGGVSGSVTGGTGSGGVSGAAPTGGVGPTGGVSGAAPTGGAAGVAGTPAGGVGPTGGTSGAGAMLVEPIQRGSLYVLEFGELFFAVDPAGARIVDVHLAGGANLLTGASINATNFGSTFWTSPQATWNWPPVPEIDSAPYTATVTSPFVEFLGPAGATRVAARVAKKFTADLQRQVVNADYSVQATAAGQTFAPWEITRVFKRGLTFWPTGSAPRAGGTFQLPPTTTAEGCTWHEAPAAAGVDQKLLADGTGGWLAHVDGDIVIVKKFPDTTMPAPNEDEIELFVSGTADYIEVEQQGAYLPLAQGMSTTWTVNWFVRRLPQGVTATPGNPALVQFVQSLVQ